MKAKLNIKDISESAKQLLDVLSVSMQVIDEMYGIDISVKDYKKTCGLKTMSEARQRLLKDVEQIFKLKAKFDDEESGDFLVANLVSSWERPTLEPFKYVTVHFGNLFWFWVKTRGNWLLGYEDWKNGAFPAEQNLLREYSDACFDKLMAIRDATGEQIAFDFPTTVDENEQSDREE